eukprot:6235584-Amphidinium_carterae.3
MAKLAASSALRKQRLQQCLLLHSLEGQQPPLPVLGIKPLAEDHIIRARPSMAPGYHAQGSVAEEPAIHQELVLTSAAAAATATATEDIEDLDAFNRSVVDQIRTFEVEINISILEALRGRVEALKI